MQRSFDANPSERDAGATVRAGRGFGGWRIPLPGRLSAFSDTRAKSAGAHGQEDVFRRDLHHFLASRATTPAKNGRD
jgi:hypothetical protein